MSGEKRTGRVVRTRDGRLQGIVILADGRQHRLSPPFPRGTSLERAKDRTLFWQRKIDAEGLVAIGAPGSPTPAAESIAAYLDRLFEHREKRGLKRQPGERARLRNHVEPVLAGLRSAPHGMGDVTPEHCRAVVEALDAKAAEGELEAVTAFKVWASWKMACKEACSSKLAALRVAPSNPCDTVQAPDKGSRKAKQWLYPGEFAALVSCPDVPLRWRRLYALAVYLCARAGELGALECEDVDLTHGRVRIHRSMDRETRKIGPTKTHDVRELDPPAPLLPLLGALVRERKSGRLLDLPPFETLATTLREHLRRAGVTRRELHESTDTSLHLWFHDLRATGLSWLAMLPDWTAYDVRDYAGHSEQSTTDRYIRRGRKARGIVGEPFPTLPPDLRGGAVEVITEVITDGAPEADPAFFMLPELASPTGFEDPALSPDAGSPGQTAEGDAEAEEPPGASTPRLPACDQPGDHVEAALSEAIRRAAQRDEWAAVEALTAELKARREARAGVVDLAAERRRRDAGR